MHHGDDQKSHTLDSVTVAPINKNSLRGSSADGFIAFLYKTRGRQKQRQLCKHFEVTVRG